MLTGHYAASFFARFAGSKIPMYLLLLFPQAVDVLWGVLVLSRVELVEFDSTQPGFLKVLLNFMPYSHSIFMNLVWIATTFAILFIATRSINESTTAAMVVASHWLFDYFVHRPDLPLGVVGNAAETKFGLMLWQFVEFEYLLEILLVLVGGGLVAWKFEEDRKASAILTSTLVFIQTLQTWVIPTPESETLLALSALGLYFAVSIVGWWLFDRKPVEAKLDELIQDDVV